MDRALTYGGDILLDVNHMCKHVSICGISTNLEGIGCCPLVVFDASSPDSMIMLSGSMLMLV